MVIISVAAVAIASVIVVAVVVVDVTVVAIAVIATIMAAMISTTAKVIKEVLVWVAMRAEVREVAVPIAVWAAPNIVSLIRGQTQ